MTWLASLESGEVAAIQTRLKKLAHNMAFRVRIWGALEIKLSKSAKVQRTSFRRERIHFVKDADGFQHYAANDLQALRAEFVDRILRTVPENVVVSIGEVDKVGRRHAPLQERKVIIADLILAREKMGLISQTLCRFAHNVLQPWS